MAGYRVGRVGTPRVWLERETGILTAGALAIKSDHSNSVFVALRVPKRWKCPT